jgi:membrane protease YdiL (CAAX protease family)
MMFSPRLVTTLRVFAYWILFIGVLLLVGRFFKPVFPDRYDQFVYGIGGTIGTFALTLLFIGAEKKSLGDYGLVWEPGTLFRFFKGMLYGILIFAGLILLLVLLGGIRIRLSSLWESSSLFWYLPILPLAIFEEIAFRSYPFLKLNKQYPFLATQLIVALVFAVYHISMGWNPMVAFLGPGLWALVFGLGAFWSKGIALPTGIHVALNLSQQITSIKGTTTGTVFELTADPTAALLSPDTVGIIGQVLVGLVALYLTIRQTGKSLLK